MSLRRFCPFFRFLLDKTLKSLTCCLLKPFCVICHSFYRYVNSLFFCVKGNQVLSISLTIWLVCWCISHSFWQIFFKCLKCFVCHLLITKPELSMCWWLDIRHGLNVGICMWLTVTVNLSDSVFESQTRHQNGDTHFLTLDEILDETKLLDITLKQKQWLMNEVEICIIYTTNVIFTKSKQITYVCLL